MVHRGKQRYYNFIADELAKDTLFNHKDGMVLTPWKNEYYPDDLYIGTNFLKYIMSNYGAKRSERKEIWLLYVKKITNIVNG